MSETLIILGAGASASCGAPLMANFLDLAEEARSGSLDTEAAGHFDAVFNAIEALNRAHTKASLDTDNVEDVFGALEMADLLELDSVPTELAAAMRTVIARTIEAHVEFPITSGSISPAEDYLLLSNWIKGGMSRAVPRQTVLTFNYDCALDFALWKNGLGIDYGLSDDGLERPGVELLKLHGSLNWVRTADDIVPYPIGQLEKRITHRLSTMPPGGSESVTVPFSQMALQQHHKGTGVDGELAIVPPVWSKLEHYGAMRRIWSPAAEALRRADRIVVCGYSLPATDQFFRHLYALGTIGPTRIKGFHVLDPDRGVEARFQNLLGALTRQRFEWVNARSDYLAHWLEKLV